MLERIRIRNFKALRDVTLDLTPIHVLIGPRCWIGRWIGLPIRR